MTSSKSDAGAGPNPGVRRQSEIAMAPAHSEASAMGTAAVRADRQRDAGSEARAADSSPVFRLRAGARHRMMDRGGESRDGLGYILRSGCLLIDVTLPDGRRHVHILHYPGDAIVPQALPPALDVAMVALNDCQLDRVAAANLGPATSSALDRQGALMYPASIVARSAIHSTAISRLTGEERLATLLLEMALYLGFDAPGGRVFEQPLARRDIADLLGLNPDTLSRIMTRLRNDGIVSVPTRARMIVHDLVGLAQLTPLAASVQALHRSSMAPAAA